jgi:acyl-CoA thioester hydrolase
MSGTTIYRSALRPEWVDEFGHLRRSYFALVLSLASDALMDYLGLGEPYRVRTDCTLYTLEMHMHWLRDVNADDTLEIDAHLLASDNKRLHVGFDVRRTDGPDVVATSEFVYLHVHRGKTSHAVPFPPDIDQAISEFKVASGAGPWVGPGSRPMVIDQ